MDSELGKSGKFVLSGLALSAAALQFFYALVPYETDRKIGEAYRPFGISMSMLFLFFSLYGWYRRISRKAGLLIFLGLIVIDIGGTLAISAIFGPGA